MGRSLTRRPSTPSGSRGWRRSSAGNAQAPGSSPGPRAVPSPRSGRRGNPLCWRLPISPTKPLPLNKLDIHAERLNSIRTTAASQLHCRPAQLRSDACASLRHPKVPPAGQRSLAPCPPVPCPSARTLCMKILAIDDSPTPAAVHHPQPAQAFCPIQRDHRQGWRRGARHGRIGSRPS